MKTQSNSSPLAEWIVIIWTASSPAWAWLSPASSEAWVRKAASGDMISPVSVSGTRRGGGDDLAARHDLGAGRRVFRAPGFAAEAGEAVARAGLVDRQRDRVLAEALLGDEGLGGVDQLLEVLEPVLAFAVGLVEVDQARGLEHVDDDLAQGQAARRLAHRVDPGDEGAAGCRRPCRRPRRRSARGCGRWPGPRPAAARGCASRCRGPGSSPPAGSWCRRSGSRSGAGTRAHA